MRYIFNISILNLVLSTCSLYDDKRSLESVPNKKMWLSGPAGPSHRHEPKE